MYCICLSFYDDMALVYPSAISHSLAWALSIAKVPNIVNLNLML